MVAAAESCIDATRFHVATVLASSQQRRCIGTGPVDVGGCHGDLHWGSTCSAQPFSCVDSSACRLRMSMSTRSNLTARLLLLLRGCCTCALNRRNQWLVSFKIVLVFTLKSICHLHTFLMLLQPTEASYHRPALKRLCNMFQN